MMKRVNNIINIYSDVFMNWHSPGSRKSGTKEVATFYISRQPWKVIATWFFLARIVSMVGFFIRKKSKVKALKRAFRHVKKKKEGVGTVSYTHLTLRTIYSV